MKPQVIVTFEPHGGHYHADRVAIQGATTAAFSSSGVMERKAPDRPPPCRAPMLEATSRKQPNSIR